MLIASETISQAWEESIRALLKCENFVSTQRGMRALELQNVLFEIEKPFLKQKVSSKYQFSQDFIKTYCESIRNSFPGDSIKSRIYEFGGSKVDQYSGVIHRLKASHDTRRAVISLWDPLADRRSGHPPCTLVLQFLCRNHRLYLTTMLRSNDAWLAALPDMIALSEVQKEMASELSLEVGTYSQLSVSYHIYEPDVTIAEAVFKSE